MKVACQDDRFRRVVKDEPHRHNLDGSVRTEEAALAVAAALVRLFHPQEVAGGVVVCEEFIFRFAAQERLRRGGRFLPKGRFAFKDAGDVRAARRVHRDPVAERVAVRCLFVGASKDARPKRVAFSRVLGEEAAAAAPLRRVCDRDRVELGRARESPGQVNLARATHRDVRAVNGLCAADLPGEQRSSVSVVLGDECIAELVFDREDRRAGLRRESDRPAQVADEIDVRGVVNG